jgi:hypothetical protein
MHSVEQTFYEILFNRNSKKLSKILNQDQSAGVDIESQEVNLNDEESGEDCLLTDNKDDNGDIDEDSPDNQRKRKTKTGITLEILIRLRQYLDHFILPEYWIKESLSLDELEALDEVWEEHRDRCMDQDGNREDIWKIRSALRDIPGTDITKEDQFNESRIIELEGWMRQKMRAPLDTDQTEARTGNFFATCYDYGTFFDDIKSYISQEEKKEALPLMALTVCVYCNADGAERKLSGCEGQLHPCHAQCYKAARAKHTANCPKCGARQDSPPRKNPHFLSLSSTAAQPSIPVQRDTVRETWVSQLRGTMTKAKSATAFNVDLSENIIASSKTRAVKAQIVRYPLNY